MFCIAGETLFVYFLGTSGALPTIHRNLPCILLKWGSHDMLFDCGEGAQQQMMRARTGFSIQEIFISHWHADHFLGIIGLLQTMTFNGRTDPITIYGPDCVHEIVDDIRNLCRTKFSFNINSVKVRDGDEIKFSGFSVRVFSVDHGIPCVGYCFEEDKRPGRFNREEAIRLGVKPGPLFGKLQRGETVTVQVEGEETEIRAEQIVGPRRNGRKVIYTGDTRPVTDKMLETCKNADLLIHDATFENSEQERAREFCHSTAGEAGASATALSAEKLALFHISSRYTSIDSHKKDAKAEFEGEIIVPCDLDSIEIPFHD